MDKIDSRRNLVTSIAHRQTSPMPYLPFHHDIGVNERRDQVIQTLSGLSDILVSHHRRWCCQPFHLVFLTEILQVVDQKDDCRCRSCPISCSYSSPGDIDHPVTDNHERCIGLDTLSPSSAVEDRIRSLGIPQVLRIEVSSLPSLAEVSIGKRASSTVVSIKRNYSSLAIDVVLVPGAKVLIGSVHV